MKVIGYLVEADDEFMDALVYYRAADPRLAAEFRRAVDVVLADIANGLVTYARVPRSPCRQGPVPGFPYSLIYAETPTEIRVTAIAHNKRRPGYWKSRLRRPRP